MSSNGRAYGCVSMGLMMKCKASIIWKTGPSKEATTGIAMRLYCRYLRIVGKSSSGSFSTAQESFGCGMSRLMLQNDPEATRCLGARNYNVNNLRLSPYAGSQKH